MATYSMHVEGATGGMGQFMTELSAPNASDAIRSLLYVIDPEATTAKIEIVEVLDAD